MRTVATRVLLSLSLSLSLSISVSALVPSSDAHAGDYYLESPELPAKSDANAASQAAVDAGLEPRIVRRLGEQSGWRYLVRVEGLDDASQAEAAASSLAKVLHAAVGVYEVRDGNATLVATVDGEPRATATPPAKATPTPARAVPTKTTTDDGGDDEADVSDAEPLLSAAARAHKVVGLDVQRAPVQLRFRRDLGDAGVADHLFARRGDDLYLEVKPVSGPVVSSRLKVIGDKAWLSVDGGPWTEQNGEKARQTAEAMGPTKVLPFVLVLDSALQTRRELQRMEHVGKGTLDGKSVQVLAFEGDQVAGPVQVEIGASDLVERVSFDGGELVYRYAKPAKLGGAWLPSEVTTQRGGEQVDRVTLTELDVGAKMPANWFEAP